MKAIEQMINGHLDIVGFFDTDIRSELRVADHGWWVKSSRTTNLTLFQDSLLLKCAIGKHN